MIKHSFSPKMCRKNLKIGLQDKQDKNQISGCTTTMGIPDWYFVWLDTGAKLKTFFSYLKFWLLRLTCANVCEQRRLWRDCAGSPEPSLVALCGKYHNLMNWLICGKWSWSLYLPFSVCPNFVVSSLSALPLGAGGGMWFLIVPFPWDLIRIFNGCEVLIKNSVTRLTVHASWCRIILARCQMKPLWPRDKL